MSIVADSTPKVSRLNDPNLAFLASRAAIELDRILQGKPKGTDAVVELGHLLKNSTEHSAGGEPAALLDPTTISLIHRAIEARGSAPVASLQDLLSQALDIARQLEATTGPSNNSNAGRLRSFCIGLANSAVAQERAQIESALEKSLWS